MEAPLQPPDIGIGVFDKVDRAAANLPDGASNRLQSVDIGDEAGLIANLEFNIYQKSDTPV
jgi:hypothetical protein